ncbi:MAG: hypothetical protein CFE21_06310 [Bacteroidetes bacterium B1(2017)]|nr:MAG: hypothetical protein CFE21_06310 [Bacteroidetes bacterium B1(2017)]
MKTKLFLLILVALLGSCDSDPRANLAPTGSFGETFTPSESILDVSNLPAIDSSIAGATQISGTIEKYCKGEGCWLTLKQGNSYLRVNTKDKKFILPKNIDGKHVTANGLFIPNEDKEGNPFTFEATGIIISE